MFGGIGRLLTERCPRAEPQLSDAPDREAPDSDAPDSEAPDRDAPDLPVGVPAEAGGARTPTATQRLATAAALVNRVEIFTVSSVDGEGWLRTGCVVTQVWHHLACLFDYPALVVGALKVAR